MTKAAEPLESQKAMLVELLRSSYDQFAWHGPNLTQALAGAGVPIAAWRPAPGDWNIHEITLPPWVEHAHYQDMARLETEPEQAS